MLSNYTLKESIFIYPSGKDQFVKCWQQGKQRGVLINCWSLELQIGTMVLKGNDEQNVKCTYALTQQSLRIFIKNIHKYSMSHV